MSMVAPSLRGRVSRRDVALSPHVWFAVWASFGFLAAAVVVLAFVMPDVTQGRMFLLGGVLATIAVVLSRLRPPEPGTPAAHVALSLVYLGPALSSWAFAPHGSGVIVATIFVGALASIWLIERWHVVAHLIAATFVLFTPSLLGAVDEATLFACIALTPALWILTVCCVLIMEAAETQGRDLERMVGIDPLTGLGNRRSLDDQLTNELARHSASHRPLTVLTLDLNRFEKFNDVLGHAAGDELLEAVAKTLTDAARGQDIVIRLRGDEFCVLLPNTGADAAAARVRVLREHLAQISEFGSGVTAGFGLATYPADGATKTELLRTADQRLQIDKLALSDAPSPVGLAAELASRVEAPARRIRASTPPPESPFDDRITRADLTASRIIWRLTGAVVLGYTALGLGLLVIAPHLAGATMPYTLAFGAVTGTVILVTRPPAAGSRAGHLATAVTYVMPVMAFVSCQPGGSVAIGTAVFVGGLTAQRSPDRKSLAIHLLLAQALFFSLIPLGLVDAITSIGILLVINVMWVIAGSFLFVLEAIEAQGAELAVLSRRDPLTGVGNRRLLHEQLGREIPVHAAAHRPMTIVTLDLDGFGELNERLGHAVADDLLITVASRLRSASKADATVTRQSGDEFCVILPNTSTAEAEVAIQTMRHAVEGIDIAGLTVTAGIGAATYPFDGTDTVTLLERADERLLLDRYPVPDLAAQLSA